MNKKLDIDLKIEFYPIKGKGKEEEIKDRMRLCKKYYELVLHEKPDDLFLIIDEKDGNECKGLYFFTKQHMVKFDRHKDNNQENGTNNEITLNIKPISKQVTNVEVNYKASNDFILTFRIYPCCERLIFHASERDSNKLKDIMDEFIIPNLREG
jgi:hypothetical protein